MHAATGLSRGDFEGLDASEDLAALGEALREREERRERRDARFMALFCNLLAGGKRTWTEKDFLHDPGAVPPESEEARQAIEAYRARVGEGRRLKRG